MSAGAVFRHVGYTVFTYCLELPVLLRVEIAPRQCPLLGSVLCWAVSFAGQCLLLGSPCLTTPVFILAPEQTGTLETGVPQAFLCL